MMIIAIDGPSGTGKSTIAKGVAKKLNFAFFDTGAMYRSLAWWLLSIGVDLDNIDKITAQLPNFKYELQGSSAERKYFVAGTDISNAIRSHEISFFASKIAAYVPVRQLLVEMQRNFGSSTNAVFEGRDMGTVVFPNADVKIFLTANLEVRAQRRFLELASKSPKEKISKDQILRDLQTRDLNDSTRAISPLKQAFDAILIDTSQMTAEQVIQQIVNLIQVEA